MANATAHVEHTPCPANAEESWAPLATTIAFNQICSGIFPCARSRYLLVGREDKPRTLPPDSQRKTRVIVATSISARNAPESQASARTESPLSG